MLANTYAQVLQFFQTYGVLAVLAVILVVGILRIFLRYLTARDQVRTARAFRERFQTFANSSGEDIAAYERLAFLAERMGNTMGQYALLDAKPPFSTHSGKGFVTVLQYIPELRRHFADLAQGGYGLGNDGASWIYHNVDDALIRFLGSRDETGKSSARKLINPIAWFREGVERILALPFYILSWFGLIEPAGAARAEQRGSFRAIAGLAAIVTVTFIASTLIFGEEKTNAASRATYRGIVDTSARTVSSSVKSLGSLADDVTKVILTPKEPQ
ncbi:MAG: hypothetical protein ACI8S3_000058 [Alphaproteobacteria bacterium]|jgi:hypothetical protein